ncbi:serine aminopeptidase domain-containing protein [Marinobacter sp.]|uniref:alpha/beta hydrolase family protein n=1 Tax=Marinobacter sp. TaxID=50741 RepID=UPI003567C3A6
MIQPEVHNLVTDAGHTLTARLFTTDCEDVRGICIIAPATGVAQYLYDDFARWLNTQGFHALTFDYEGMGLSLNGHVKDSQSDILSWAKYDCPAVLKFAKDHFNDLRLIWIGHSVGGHMIGYMGHNPDIDQVISVACGTGTWWHNAPPTKRIAWFLWYVLVPVTVPFLGYFPGDRLKVMCNMPKGVIMQWRRWCLAEEYAVGCEGRWLRERFASVHTPITAIEFSDDDMMSPTNVRMLHEFFVNAPQKHILVTPKDVNQKRIGHIGWHRKRYLKLWEKIFAPILNDRSMAQAGGDD